MRTHAVTARRGVSVFGRSADESARDRQHVPMGRTADEIDDATPLAGSRIDLGARIGWLLRTWRVGSGVTLRGLRERLTEAGAAYSAATLSRFEVSGTRSSVAIAAYERALGLPYGRLRAPVDVVCRTFAYAPPDLAPVLPEPSLAAFSAACDAVGESPTGHDWLRFAEHHALGGFGLPLGEVEGHITRLASELGRSTGLGYQLRYEALAKLRCSAYADVVYDVVRAAVAEPGVQRLADLLSAVSEQPTPELLAWCGTLLCDDSPVVGRAACLAIQNIRSVIGSVGTEGWLRLAPVYAEACNAFADDPARGPLLSSTLAACAPPFRTAVRERLTVSLPEPRRASRWSRDRLNEHFALAMEIAATAAAGRTGEQMLARLVFELLYDFRATHSVTSAFLVAASVFATDVQKLLSGAALSGPDEVTRHGAAYAFANLMLRPDDLDLAQWLASEDPVILGAGLHIAGFAGHALPMTDLCRLARDGGDTARDALFAAGMAGHPELPALSVDPSLPAEVRAGAAWWLRSGARVID